MKTQMTKDDYEKLVRIKKRELFEVNYQITIAESNDKKNLLMQKKEIVKRELAMAMTNLELYGSYNKIGEKGRGK